MRAMFLWALLLVSVCVVAASASSGPIPPTQGRVDTRVVRLVCMNTSTREQLPDGTAFFIDRSGNIITASHLFFDAAKRYNARGSFCVPAVDFWGTPIRVMACTLIDISDVTECRLEKNPFSLRLRHQPTVLGLDLSKPASGSRITVIGFPGESLNPVVRSGYVITNTTDPVGDPVIEYSAEAEQGMSGGPILNGDGKVIGVMHTRGEGNKADELFVVPQYGRPAGMIKKVMRLQMLPLAFHDVAP